MAYATQADIEAMHGGRFLENIADRDNNGAIDTAAVTRALDEASAEIDSYLSMRYATPLATTPAIVRMAAVEIGAYRLANSGLGLTEDIRKRYDDMIKLMQRIGDGKANTGDATLDPAPASVVPDDLYIPAAFSGRVSRI